MAFYYLLGMSCCFFGSMRCKSWSANKFKHHVSCVLPPSHLRIYRQFKVHQERIKICNPYPKNFLWEIISGGIGDALHSSKIKVGSCQTNSKTHKNRMRTIVLWKQMKGIWAKYCEIRENMKGQENHYRKEPGWILFRGISQGEKLI